MEITNSDGTAQRDRFEKEICDHLGSNGWIYGYPVAQDYDREKAIYTPDLIAWVQELA